MNCLRRAGLLCPRALGLLVGLEALQLHGPLAAEEAPGDLGAAALLQGLLHETADRGAHLALTGEIQDLSHLVI